MQDGGAKGLECTTKDIDPDPKIRVLNTTCDWDKVPDEALHYYKKEPIKSRRKSFDELKSLVKDDLKKHCNRSPKNGLKEGRFINVFDKQFEMELTPIHISYSALNDIIALYNTNGTWSRSGNPGFFAKLSYNVGYIEYSDGWGYQNESDQDVIFAETAAHDIGHPILLG